MRDLVEWCVMIVIVALFAAIVFMIFITLWTMLALD